MSEPRRAKRPAPAPRRSRAALERRLLGTWKLVSAVREEIPSGRKTDFFGKNPTGFLQYGADGRMIVLIVRAGRKGPAGTAATPTESAALFKSAMSYSGSYAVKGDEVVHRVDTSLNESWTGSEQRRHVRLAGGRLRLSTPPSSDPIDGLHSVRTMTWERA